MLPTLERLPARLVTVGDDRRTGYRLLVVGPAFLERPAATAAPWLVRVTTDGTFLPSWPTPRPAGDHRLAAALLEPRDLPAVGRDLRFGLHGAARARIEFYGWSLVYQLPGDGGVARVDPGDDFPELPAFFESPLEVADRQEFLARRGVASRALALLTQPGDFDRGVSPPRNHRFPGAKWHRAASLGLFAR